MLFILSQVTEIIFYIISKIFGMLYAVVSAGNYRTSIQSATTSRAGGYEGSQTQLRRYLVLGIRYWYRDFFPILDRNQCQIPIPSTNIISYGFRDHLEHLVTIQIMRENGTLTLSVEDDGIPFNPLKTRENELPCDIENCKIGGVGLKVVKKLVQPVCYERCAGKNKLRLKKAIERS